MGNENFILYKYTPFYKGITVEEVDAEYRPIHKILIEINDNFIKINEYDLDTIMNWGTLDLVMYSKSNNNQELFKKLYIEELERQIKNREYLIENIKKAKV